MKISVLEPGAWGTALGILLSKKNEVSFWYDDFGLAFKISKTRNNERLAGVKIPKKIFISSNLKKVLANSNLVIIASPSFNFRKTLMSLREIECLPPLVGIAKGCEKRSLKFPSQIVEEIFAKIPYVHLSGPGFAREIIKGKPAKEVIASEDKILLNELKEVFNVNPLKVSFTTDLIGVQLAGSLKNTLAIGVSLVEAGLNSSKKKNITKDLIQIALKEMTKLGKAMGAEEKTFLGPAGLEDLILTATNPLSRNFQFGKSLYFDAGELRKDIKERRITVEGFDNAWALYKLGQKYNLDLPMLNEIYNLIYKKTSPKIIVKNLIKLAEAERE